MTLPGRDDDQDVLGELLLLTLDKIVGTFEHAGVDLPGRRYISYGGVAADCEQLTVELAQIYPGLPAADPNQLHRCEGPRTAVIIAQLFRKVPVASGPRGTGAPTPGDLTASALTLVRDVWLLLDAAGAVDSAGWGTGVIAEVTPISASGGLTGANLTLTLTVP